MVVGMFYLHKIIYNIYIIYIMSNKKIFDLLKNKEFDKIYDMINNDEIKNLDIYDEQYNYLIYYLIIYNLVDIIKLIFKKKIKCRLDIIDHDGRCILYNCIKFNYTEIADILIKINNINIGISIIDIIDKIGYNSYHYCVIFNNLSILQLLTINTNNNIYATSNDNKNIFILAIEYNRTEIFDFLISKKYDMNFLTSNGDSILQQIILYNNIKMFTSIIDNLLKYNININNINFDNGFNALHQSVIINNYDMFVKLIDNNININIQDFYGYSVFHYILLEGKFNFLDILLNNDVNYNPTNIDGDTPLHIILKSSKLHELDNDVLVKIIKNSDLSIINNCGQSCFALMVEKQIYTKYKDILINKYIHYILPKKYSNDLLELLVDSYYNQIKINPELDVFNICTSKKNDCKKLIKSRIIKHGGTIVYYKKLNMIIDNNIITNNYKYFGFYIDILFGLLYLHKTFKDLNILCTYPLTKNEELINYYDNNSINYSKKTDFINFEIIWYYQKLIFPSYFNDEINKLIKHSKYIIIPIGIETLSGSHSNILFWDVKNNTVERFEPNGANYPLKLNYNPALLDCLLKNKFSQFNKDITYYAPFDFLPSISFQILENNEEIKYNITDPTGFCAVWCIWWIEQRINNINISNKELALTLIQTIKLQNYKFKDIIRKYSNNITNYRDTILKKVNLNINDWMNEHYTDKDIQNLEKYILNDIID
jgi:ankyrin repeat protein